MQLTTAIDNLILQGFSIAAREPASVTMVKRKQFSLAWAVVGFILFVLPLLIYLISYETEHDHVVFIRMAAAPPSGLPQQALSPDRRHWWDGAAWQPADVTVPPGALRSPDGSMWWDGVEWRPVNRAAG